MFLPFLKIVPQDREILSEPGNITSYAKTDFVVKIQAVCRYSYTQYSIPHAGGNAEASSRNIVWESKLSKS